MTIGRKYTIDADHHEGIVAELAADDGIIITGAMAQYDAIDDTITFTVTGDAWLGAVSYTHAVAENLLHIERAADRVMGA